MTTAIRSRLAQRAPRLNDAATRAGWRLRNRGRATDVDVAPELAAVVARLRANGVVLSDVQTVFGDRALYKEAAERARRLYETRPQGTAAAAGSKETFLTKLTGGEFDVHDPFVRLALHPNALAVANAYLRLRSTLRAIELWHTRPTEGPAVQTQLWHRDGDDIVNVKMFVYFTDVTRGAGPLTYAPRTHPFGSQRKLPERDEHLRSTDEQMARIVDEREWIVCEGGPGTVVFADTCGYHKQLKPETDERLLVVSHYVSGTPYVPRAIELRGVSEDALTDDQYVAVFDRTR